MFFCIVFIVFSVVFFLMIRRPPRSTRTDTLFPTRRSSDLILTATTVLTSALTAAATTVYPLDRATILSASPFDVKVEFDGIVSAADVTVAINGQPIADVLGKEAEFIEREDDLEASAVRINGVVISDPGTYEVVANR